MLILFRDMKVTKKRAFGITEIRWRFMKVDCHFLDNSCWKVIISQSYMKVLTWKHLGSILVKSLKLE